MWSGGSSRVFNRRVEGGVSDLVGFVEDINLKAITRRLVTCGFAQFADFVDAAVGSGVDLDHVDSIAGTNLRAGFANAARLRHRLIG